MRHGHVLSGHAHRDDVSTCSDHPPTTYLTYLEVWRHRLAKRAHGGHSYLCGVQLLPIQSSETCGVYLVRCSSSLCHTSLRISLRVWSRLHLSSTHNSAFSRRTARLQDLPRAISKSSSANVGSPSVSGTNSSNSVKDAP